MITRELIEARIRDLTVKREQAIAQANAYLGAVEDAQWFLTQLDEGVGTAPAPSANGVSNDDLCSEPS
jgi:hypothetical protein